MWFGTIHGFRYPRGVLECIPAISADYCNQIVKSQKQKGSEKQQTREKQLVTYKATPIRLSVDFSAETLQARGSAERKKLPSKNTIPSKTDLQKWSNKEFPRLSGWYWEGRESA